MSDSIWQRGFHGHIIRDNVDHFFIEQYIELNPLLWYMDSDNPELREASFEQLRDTLRNKHGLDGFALVRMIEHELAYREWRARRRSGESNPPNDSVIISRHPQ